MRSCSAGIFIFSRDEEVRDPNGSIVKRPRPNVVYELGAASFQYGQRIVVFKERGVEFPTDFRDLGYIEYEKDQLSAKSMELLRELIKLRAVRVLPGA
jgi:predicted nucleotide-binding protein